MGGNLVYLYYEFLIYACISILTIIYSNSFFLIKLNCLILIINSFILYHMFSFLLDVMPVSLVHLKVPSNQARSSLLLSIMVPFT